MYQRLHIHLQLITSHINWYNIIQKAQRENPTKNMCFQTPWKSPALITSPAVQSGPFSNKSRGSCSEDSNDIKFPGIRGIFLQLGVCVLCCAECASRAAREKNEHINSICKLQSCLSNYKFLEIMVISIPLRHPAQLRSPRWRARPKDWGNLKSKMSPGFGLFLRRYFFHRP